MAKCESYVILREKSQKCQNEENRSFLDEVFTEHNKFQ